jgi:hypothetical protein
MSSGVAGPLIAGPKKSGMISSRLLTAFIQKSFVEGFRKVLFVFRRNSSSVIISPASHAAPRDIFAHISGE